MRLIHCADLHLDSKMNSHFDKEKAKERKAELLQSYKRMIQFGEENGVAAILISGDMFDTKRISATTRNTVLDSIVNHPDMHFYYLRGNHDSDGFLTGLEEIPSNLFLFDDEWQIYEEAGGKLTISGVELTKDNAGSVSLSLVLDDAKCNIVMMHGQESESSGKDKTELIPLKDFKNKGVDYMALGHIHGYKKATLDARGVYCYAGCLEGRGFDEAGDHGFVLLDFDEESGNLSSEFISQCYRRIYVISADVTGCSNTAEMIRQVEEQIKKESCSEKDLVKLVLAGTLDVECEKDVDFIHAHFKDDFYFLKIYDETKLQMDMDAFLLDESLKGEFVRQVMSDAELSEDEKKSIIRFGLQAIAGEEVQ